MSRRIDLAMVVWMVAGVVAASGCQQTAIVTSQPPAYKAETFQYQPLVTVPPRTPKVRAEAPVPAPVVVAPRIAQASLPIHEASWVPAAGVEERPWRWIVVHHSGTDTGSAAALDAFHRNARHWDELGYHFVIGNGTGSANGGIEVGSRWPKQKWGAHCRVGDNEEYNYYGIGICLVGDFEKHRPSPAQMASLAKLVDYLAAKYRIDDAHIIGHSTVDDTRCPGRHFPFDDLFARLHHSRATRQSAVAAAPALVGRQAN